MSLHTTTDQYGYYYTTRTAEWATLPPPKRSTSDPDSPRCPSSGPFTRQTCLVHDPPWVPNSKGKSKQRLDLEVQQTLGPRFSLRNQPLHVTDVRLFISCCVRGRRLELLCQSLLEYLTRINLIANNEIKICVLDCGLPNRKRDRRLRVPEFG